MHIKAKTPDKRSGPVQATHQEAFEKVRLMLHANAVLAHPDYEAAQNPQATGEAGKRRLRQSPAAAKLLPRWEPLRLETECGAW